MKVIVTVHMKDIVYTGVVLVRTEGDNVILTLKDDYTVSDQSFSMEHNISFVPDIHHFVDCSSIAVIEEH